MANTYTGSFSVYKTQPDFNKDLERGVLESYLKGTWTVKKAAEEITAPSSDRHQRPNGQVGRYGNYSSPA
jgi:hypothetical protein